MVVDIYDIFCRFVHIAALYHILAARIGYDEQRAVGHACESFLGRDEYIVPVAEIILQSVDYRSCKSAVAVNAYQRIVSELPQRSAHTRAGAYAVEIAEAVSHEYHSVRLLDELHKVHAEYAGAHLGVLYLLRCAAEECEVVVVLDSDLIAASALCHIKSFFGVFLRIGDSLPAVADTYGYGHVRLVCDHYRAHLVEYRAELFAHELLEIFLIYYDKEAVGGYLFDDAAVLLHYTFHQPVYLHYYSGFVRILDIGEKLLIAVYEYEHHPHPRIAVFVREAEIIPDVLEIQQRQLGYYRTGIQIALGCSECLYAVVPRDHGCDGLFVSVQLFEVDIKERGYLRAVFVLVRYLFRKRLVVPYYSPCLVHDCRGSWEFVQ